MSNFQCYHFFRFFYYWETFRNYVWPLCSSSVELGINLNVWEPEYTFIKFWVNGSIYYWKIWDRNLSYFNSTSISHLPHFEMTIELKIFVFRGIAAKAFYFNPMHQPVNFWCPRNTPSGSQVNFSKPFTKFFRIFSSFILHRVTRRQT